MAWRTAKAILSLRREVYARWGTSVGSIGDPSHAARKSDHNPDYRYGVGVVSAGDVMGRTQGKAVWDHIVSTRDNRVEYMVHAGRITGSDLGWRERAYTGSNPHTDHCHVSVGRGSEGIVERPDLFDDGSPWGIDGDTPTTPPPSKDTTMFDACKRGDGPGDLNVKSWQRLLYNLGFLAKPDFDGDYGAATQAAVSAAVNPDKNDGSQISDWEGAAILSRLDGGGTGGGLSQADADSRYATASHRHSEGITGRPRT